MPAVLGNRIDDGGAQVGREGTQVICGEARHVGRALDARQKAWNGAIGHVPSCQCGEAPPLRQETRSTIYWARARRKSASSPSKSARHVTAMSACSCARARLRSMPSSEG